MDRQLGLMPASAKLKAVWREAGGVACGRLLTEPHEHLDGGGGYALHMLLVTGDRPLANLA